MLLRHNPFYPKYTAFDTTYFAHECEMCGAFCEEVDFVSEICIILKDWTVIYYSAIHIISSYKTVKQTVWLTHWDRVTHICVNKLTIIGSDNGLSPGRRQAIIWTNAGISLIGPLGTNFSEILIEIETFSLKKMHLKMSSGKWRPSCLGLNVIKRYREVGNPLIFSFLTGLCSHGYCALC